MSDDRKKAQDLVEWTLNADNDSRVSDDAKMIARNLLILDAENKKLKAELSDLKYRVEIDLQPALDFSLAELDMLKDQTRWQSVEDELPRMQSGKYYAEVRVVYKFMGGRQGRADGFYDFEKEEWDCPGVHRFKTLLESGDLIVTHWREPLPLPEPPEPIPSNDEGEDDE
jgi:hypothetical protein